MKCVVHKKSKCIFEIVLHLIPWEEVLKTKLFMIFLVSQFSEGGKSAWLN